MKPLFLRLFELCRLSASHLTCYPRTPRPVNHARPARPPGPPIAAPARSASADAPPDGTAGNRPANSPDQTARRRDAAAGYGGPPALRPGRTARSASRPPGAWPSGPAPTLPTIAPCEISNPAGPRPPLIFPVLQLDPTQNTVPVQPVVRPAAFHDGGPCFRLLPVTPPLLLQDGRPVFLVALRLPLQNPRPVQPVVFRIVTPFRRLAFIRHQPTIP